MIEVEFNYEYDGRIYKMKVEKTKDAYLITFDETTYTVNATEIKPGYLKIKLGDKIIKAVISEGNESKFVFLNGKDEQIDMGVKPVEIEKEEGSKK